MDEFKVGDIVARRSYNYDVLFKIINITGNFADLVGLTVRIIADAPLYDLALVPKDSADKQINQNEMNSRMKLNRCYNRIYNRPMNNNTFNFKMIQREVTNKYLENKENTVYKKPGVVLHLDGDTYLSNQNKYSNEKILQQDVNKLDILIKKRVNKKYLEKVYLTKISFN